MVRLHLYHALLFGSCAYALLRGRADARIVAVVCIVANFATYALRSPLAGSYSSVEIGILVVDILAFLAFTYVALMSDRFWPLWISGIQLTTSFGHLMKAIHSDLLPIAYAAALRFWSYPILIILAVGVWRSQRRGRAEQIAHPSPA